MGLTKALLVFYDQDGRLIARKKDKNFGNASYLAFFGGIVHENETPEEAIQRLCMEELDMIVKEFEFFDTYEYKSVLRDNEGVKHVFIAPIENYNEIVSDREDDFGVIDRAEINNIRIVHHDKPIFLDIFNKISALAVEKQVN